MKTNLILSGLVVFLSLSSVVLLLWLTGCEQSQDGASIGVEERSPTPAAMAGHSSPAHHERPERERSLEGSMGSEVIKTNEEWKAELTPEQYHVTREKGTERAFTGKYWNHKTAGMYRCVCCGQELFQSVTKFDSGCGWPSFYSPAQDESVATAADRSFGMIRTEVTCSRCGAHLGHVFDDGPRPTGLRYCINSAALRFQGENEKSPAKANEENAATKSDGD